VVLTLAFAGTVAVLLLSGRVLPARARDLVLASGSLLFLALFYPTDAALFVAVALAVYLLGPRPGAARNPVPAAAVVLGLVAVIGWFKYLPEIRSNPAAVVVPLGLSYLVFKLIHYVVERARDNLPEHSAVEYFSWAFLVTTLAAGPIERFDHYLKSRSRRATGADVVEGLTRILFGIIKKAVLFRILALPLERLGGPATMVARLPELSTVRVWGIVILQYLKLYVDFSAYTDIAIGTSLLFGIRIMENFRWPILARNIGDFWDRWHISLSTWCRTYVYLPVIGLTRQPHLAAYATFVTIGLWHAGALHFVAFGLYHGTGVALYRTWRRRLPPAKRRPASGAGLLFAVPATFLFVTGSFALTLPFGNGSAWDGVRILLRLVGIHA
jgi:alginate O-acetyltransferase complex protein AlgI